MHGFTLFFMYIGGWGGESARTPNREIVSFRSCVRASERRASERAKLRERDVVPGARARRGSVSRFRVGSVLGLSRGCPGVVPWLSRLCQNSKNGLRLFSGRTRKTHFSSFGTSPCFAVPCRFCARRCPGLSRLSRLSRGCPGESYVNPM